MSDRNWLIEIGASLGSLRYYCGPNDWCCNQNHAHHFDTKSQAQATADRIKLVGAKPRVVANIIHETDYDEE